MKNNLFALLGLLLFAFLQTSTTITQPSGSDTVVLSLPGDDYAALAKEIAASESLPLAHGWPEALSQNPAVILWVAAPNRLSDRVMVEAGLALKAHRELPAVGVFSGGTQAEARQLWQRGRALSARTKNEPAARFFAANGEYPTAGIPQAQLVDFLNDEPQISPLDTRTMAGALQQADYCTFTGHGGGSYLRLDDETKFSASDIPALPSLVISTGSCQTFRLWSKDSIALGFIRQGAAAYAGFVYSPNEGFLIGEFQDLPFRYSWPEFPIGQIAALQNRGAMQGYAYFPYYLLLGDPRIALQPVPPYELVNDETVGDTRTLTFRGAPQGLIPVRVTGGAHYRYVEIPGLAAAANGDPFFNARLQTASLRGDKYILFTHSGGDFIIRLRQSPPWHWGLTNSLLASWDDVTLFTPQNGGDGIMVAAGILFLALALLRGWLLRHQPAVRLGRMAVAAMIAGAGVALLLGLYQMLRLPHVAITTKPLALSPLWVAGVFLLTAAAAALYWLTRSWLGKLLALLAAVLPALLPAIFSLLVIGYINLIARQQAGSAIYNLHLGTLPLIAAGLWLVVLSLALGWVEKRINFISGGKLN